MQILLFGTVCLLVFIAAFMGEDFVSSSYTIQRPTSMGPQQTYLLWYHLLRSFPVRGSFAGLYSSQNICEPVLKLRKTYNKQFVSLITVSGKQINPIVTNDVIYLRYAHKFIV